MKRLFSLVLAVLMLCTALPALAATATTFDGTVVSGQAVSVAAPFGGTVSAVQVKPGDQISVGDGIATVETCLAIDEAMHHAARVRVRQE